MHPYSKDQMVFVLIAFGNAKCLFHAEDHIDARNKAARWALYHHFTYYPGQADSDVETRFATTADIADVTNAYHDEWFR